VIAIDRSSSSDFPIVGAYRFDSDREWCADIPQRAAAAAGKHVLVEKPLAVSIDDAKTMVDACRAANVNLFVGPSHSYDSQIQLARSVIDSG
jgi:predicted dehydrogenase